ncbi:MAG TPA: DUF4184 family protein [Bacteroidales bacterium]
MPFTLSHAALVLPATYLPKKTYSLTGLVVGSFVPDFEYFIRMRDYSVYSHTWLGVLWFDLPLGIILAWLFHAVVRDALIENLPKGLFARFAHVKGFNWTEHFRKNWAIVVVSIIIGTASHIFWDDFTHGEGYFVKHISFLREHTMFFGNFIPNYSFAQHLSTLVGGAILWYAIWKMPKNEDVSQHPSKSYWINAVLISVLILSLRLIAGLNYRSFDQLIVNAISAGLMALIITPILRFRTVN